MGGALLGERSIPAVQLSARLRGVSPPVTRRLRVAEQTSLAELHAALQVAFGWSDGHLYTFQIRGWQFGDPARAIELTLAGGGVDIPLMAFSFEIGEPFLLTAASKREV
jgi:Plasmid pRiA4b ORF-3-like protein